MLDDPIIRCMERTGEPPWNQNIKTPVCPICGAECYTFYKDKFGDIAGCDECIETVDAWVTDND